MKRQSLHALIANMPRIAGIGFLSLFEKLSPPAGNRRIAPWNLNHLTLPWLTTVLCKGYPGAQVTSWQYREHSRGTTSRYSLRLHYNREGNEAGLPAKLFAKSTEQLYSRLANGLTGNVVNEPFFYNHLKSQLDIETPRCYYAAYNPRSGGSLVLMGDLKTRGAEFCGPEKLLTLAEAKSMCTLLAQLHGTFYGRVESPAFEAIKPFPDYFHDACQTIFLRQCCGQGLSMASAVLPDNLLAKRDRIWPLTQAAAASHAKLPPTLIHSDVHLGNWYRTATGEMGLCDWQCLVKGHWSRDLAYCLSTALTPEQRRSWEQELLTSYLQLMQGQGIAMPDLAKALQLYRQQLLLALAWWTGTLGASRYFAALQSKDACLAFIKRIAIALLDHEILK